MAEIDIQIRDEATTFKYKQGSFVKNKKIKTSDLISAISNISGYRSPILPPNTRFIKIDKNITTVVLEIPPTIRQIQYMAKGKMIFKDTPFPFPWEIFILKLMTRDSGAGYQLIDAYTFALKNPILSSNDNLYRFPTPNVYNSSDGRICWGSALDRNNLRNIDTLAQAYRFVSIFHDATFNTDLHPSLQNNERFEDLVRRLKDKPTFDYNVLKESGNISRIMEGFEG